MPFLGKLLVAAVFLFPVAGHSQSWGWDDGTVPYVQSPMDVVERMLRLAQPKAGERLYDLGSGDGRIVIEAAKRYGARAHGVDIDGTLVKLARERAQKAGVADLATFETKDFFELDLSNADVITAYLLPEFNEKFIPKFLALRPGSRVVTHDYEIGKWPYDEMIELPVAEKLIGPMGRSRIYLYVVPADVRGTWRSEIPGHGGRWRFDVKQEFQILDVTAHGGGREQEVRGLRLRGTEIRMVMTGIVDAKPATQAFRGEVRGDRIVGEVTVTDGNEQSRTFPWTATRAQR